MALIRSFNWFRLHVPKDGTTAANDVQTQLHMQTPSQHRIPSRSRERGAELLEFSFVMASLLALTMGIIVFARGYNVYETITRAAREGARADAVPPSYYDQVNNGSGYVDPCVPGSGTTAGGGCVYTQTNSTVFSNYIAPALTASNLNPNLVTNYSESVNWLDPGDTNEQCGVIISFQYPYSLAIPFLGTGLGTINIATRVQMRREDQSATGTCP